MAGFAWGVQKKVHWQNMPDICFEVCDVDHRVGGQVMPTARRLMYVSQLTTKPWLLEHVYLVEIQTPENALALVASIFLDNGKNYPASPSSLRGIRPILLHAVTTTPLHTKV
jgi:hypothetical protein